MRTMLLDCSPKQKYSNSSYFLSHISFLLKGEKTRYKLKKSNYEIIASELADIDVLILSMPIYVDGVPSHVLDFFEYIEKASQSKKYRFKVYVISNCGFYEGEQTKNCLSIIENWTIKCNVDYMGGLGIGAGEMFGTVRFFNVGLSVFIALLGFVISAISQLISGDFSFLQALKSIDYITVSVNIILIFVFNIFLYISAIRLTRSIRKIKKTDNFYTTVFCPRFLFVIFADLFWILRAAINKVTPWGIYKKHKLTN